MWYEVLHRLTCPLSSRDAEFMELECELTQEQEDVYNEAVSFWKVMSLSMHGDGPSDQAVPWCFHNLVQHSRLRCLMIIA